MKQNTAIYDINYNKDIDAVSMEWNGYATSDQFREGTELMLNTLIKNNCKKVLANVKDMTLIGAEDQQWLDSNFLPRAIKFGFKTIAIIKPESYFNKVAIEAVSFKVDKKNLTINFFDNIEEAAEWLKKLN
jgi:hypothetical protein